MEKQILCILPLHFFGLQYHVEVVRRLDFGQIADVIVGQHFNSLFHSFGIILRQRLTANQKIGLCYRHAVGGIATRQHEAEGCFGLSRSLVEVSQDVSRFGLRQGRDHVQRAGRIRKPRPVIVPAEGNAIIGAEVVEHPVASQQAQVVGLKQIGVVGKDLAVEVLGVGHG